MDTINRQSKLPLYQQLYDVLRGNIYRAGSGSRAT